MKPYTTVTGNVAPLLRADVDTDQIIPAVFLSRVERTGYGECLFHRWRTRPDGTDDPDFILNQPRYAHATILVSGPNFGCGSSREHAVWALADSGFRTILAPSFADIFRNNCHQNGVLPVTLPASTIERVAARSTEIDGYQMTVDLLSCTVTDDHGIEEGFDIDPFRRDCLLSGKDDIDLTLQREAEISAYEQTLAWPWKTRS